MRQIVLVSLLGACTVAEDSPVLTEGEVSDSAVGFQDTGAVEKLELDLDDSQANAEHFVRVRGSLDSDQDVFYYWSGYIYDQQDVDPYADAVTSWRDPILRFDGFNVARFRSLGDGYYDMITRVVSLYRNLRGEIIDCWTNAFLGVEESEYVEVIHIQNDPVNFTVGEVDYVELGDLIAFRMEVPLTYPSPLPVEEYPEYSAGNTYQSTELFNFYTRRSDLENADLESVPAHISWTRVGQYLPWMKMGQRAGKLVYHAQGYKVMDGWEGLPADLREWVESNAPEFAEAPAYLSFGDNMTSWRYFDKLMSEGLYDSACE